MWRITSQRTGRAGGTLLVVLLSALSWCGVIMLGLFAAVALGVGWWKAAMMVTLLGLAVAVWLER